MSANCEWREWSQRICSEEWSDVRTREDSTCMVYVLQLKWYIYVSRHFDILITYWWNFDWLYCARILSDLNSCGVISIYVSSEISTLYRCSGDPWKKSTRINLWQCRVSDVLPLQCTDSHHLAFNFLKYDILLILYIKLRIFHFYCTILCIQITSQEPPLWR